MTTSKADKSSTMVAGLLAGLAGTLAMMAMRKFDQRYAPRTIPPLRQDPGMAIVKRFESAVGWAGKVPQPLEHVKAISMNLGYGALAGAAYGALRSRTAKNSPLSDGAILGVMLYAVGYAGWLPLLGLTRPLWKQSFPQIAGETLRHVAYGVTTAAVYGAINGRR